MCTCLAPRMARTTCVWKRERKEGESTQEDLVVRACYVHLLACMQSTLTMRMIAWGGEEGGKIAAPLHENVQSARYIANKPTMLQHGQEEMFSSALGSTVAAAYTDIGDTDKMSEDRTFSAKEAPAGYTDNSDMPTILPSPDDVGISGGNCTTKSARQSGNCGCECCACVCVLMAEDRLCSKSCERERGLMRNYTNFKPCNTQALSAHFGDAFTFGEGLCQVAATMQVEHSRFFNLLSPTPPSCSNFIYMV